MVIFNSYVKLPEGSTHMLWLVSAKWWCFMFNKKQLAWDSTTRPNLKFNWFTTNNTELVLPRKWRQYILVVSCALDLWHSARETLPCHFPSESAYAGVAKIQVLHVRTPAGGITQGSQGPSWVILGQSAEVKKSWNLAHCIFRKW